MRKRASTPSLAKDNKYLRSLLGGALVAALVFIGIYYMIDSHADSPYASANADKGALAGTANIISDPLASDGHDIEFGAPLAVHVDGDKLVNGDDTVIRLLGVDANLTESQCVDSHTVSGSNPLNSAEAEDIASWKINAVRVPLNEDCWLGINGVSINGESAAASAVTYQTAIENWISALNSAGIIAILDLHWAAPGTYPSNQQWPMADEDHAPTFWTSLATTFKSNPAVIFDLFNEPFIGNTGSSTSTTAWTCWLDGCSATFNGTINGVASSSATYTTAGMQQLVNTVRSTGATQPILLSGLDYSGDPCGLKDKYGSTAACPEIANLPTDPSNQLIISYHNYFGLCSATTCWNTLLQNLDAANIPMVTDEFGESDCSDTLMNSYMDWADQNNESYMAWAWVPPNIAGTPCAIGSQYNYALLSDWNGDPSTLIPQGPDLKAHLAAVSPY
jgi:hypothetical protein